MFEGLRFENVYIFDSHLNKWDILWPFGTFWVHLVHFSAFWYHAPKNLATLVRPTKDSSAFFLNCFFSRKFDSCPGEEKKSIWRENFGA
jgi:hypothetical protein